MTGHILTTRERWLAFAVLCLGDIMIVLDTTIVNVALPTIKSNLEFNDTGLVWVVNAYLLTFGGFLLLGGRPGSACCWANARMAQESCAQRANQYTEPK